MWEIMLFQRKGGTNNLEVDKFTKFQKFGMYVFVKFLITLFNFFICELKNIKEKRTYYFKVQTKEEIIHFILVPFSLVQLKKCLGHAEGGKNLITLRET